MSPVLRPLMDQTPAADIDDGFWGESTDQGLLEVEKMDQVVIENKCQSSELLKEPEQDNIVFFKCGVEWQS